MNYQKPVIYSTNQNEYAFLAFNQSVPVLLNPVLGCVADTGNHCNEFPDAWQIQFAFNGNLAGGTCHIDGTMSPGGGFNDFDCTLGEAGCEINGTNSGTITIEGCVDFGACINDQNLNIKVTCADKDGKVSAAVEDTIVPEANLCPCVD